MAAVALKSTNAPKGGTVKQSPLSSKSKPHLPQSIDSPVNQILYLQRTIGNRAVTRLFQSGVIQARLRHGTPNDIYEQEADRVADRVMRMPQREFAPAPASSPSPTNPLAEQITPLVRRQPDEKDEEVQSKSLLQRQEEEEEEEPIQARTNTGSTTNVTPDIESNINSLKGGGQPLSEPTRAFFEPRFGADFSHVRLHTDTNAAQTAQSINAKAFTTGKDIVFNSGQYSPETFSGKHLLAHELTHVVQQGKEPGQKAVNKERIFAKTDENKEITYKVKKGERLSMIAKKFGITVGALKSKNATKLKTWKTKKGDIQGFNAGAIIVIPSQKEEKKSVDEKGSQVKEESRWVKDKGGKSWTKGTGKKYSPFIRRRNIPDIYERSGISKMWGETIRTPDDYFIERDKKPPSQILIMSIPERLWEAIISGVQPSPYKSWQSFFRALSASGRPTVQKKENTLKVLDQALKEIPVKLLFLGIKRGQLGNELRAIKDEINKVKFIKQFSYEKDSGELSEKQKELLKQIESLQQKKSRIEYQLKRIEHEMKKLHVDLKLIKRFRKFVEDIPIVIWG